MAVHKLCDRCGKVVDEAGSFLSMRRWGRPRFLGAFRRHKDNELWADIPREIDLCENCVRDFLKFVGLAKELS